MRNGERSGCIPGEWEHAWPSHKTLEITIKGGKVTVMENHI